MKSFPWLIWVVALLGVSLPSFAQPVMGASDSSTLLKDNWNRTISAQPASSSYWVVYSVEKEMCSSCYTGMNIRFLNSDEKSIERILFGRMTPPLTVEASARKAIDSMDGKDEARVWKEIAVIFEWQGQKLQSIHWANVNASFDFKDRPIFWLGMTNAEQSTQLALSLSIPKDHLDLRKSQIWLVGMHPQIEASLNFIESIAFSEGDVELRKAAVYSLGSFDTTESVRLLKRFLTTDADIEIKKSAVYALGNNDSPEARKVLLDLIASAKS